MSRLESLCLHLSTFLVGGTGLVYAVMLYVLESSDPYSVVNHPLQPTVQHLHIWVAPLLIFAVGLIWRQHVWQHWKRGVRRRRFSGAMLMLVAAPMIVSGTLIQTAVSDGWRQVWIVVHLVTSGLWLVGYAAHHLARGARARGHDGARQRLTPGVTRVAEGPAKGLRHAVSAGTSEVQGT